MSQLPVIHVACGVLRRADGALLLAQRPEGKIAAGYWEFPGGKIEPGEDPRAALDRELLEELGVVVTRARRLIRLRHAYRDRVVVLDTWLVDGFAPEPASRENQALAWVAPDAVDQYQVLPTVAPILAPLRLPPDYAFTPPQAAADFILGRLPQLPAGALLRLRLPALDEARYAALASRLAPAIRAAGLRLVLDRAPNLSQQLGCAWHAPVPIWRALVSRPKVPCFLASAHDAAELAALRALGADAAVLGPVLATATHPQQPPLGWDAFADAALEAGLPVYALGGVGPRERERAWARGGQGCAGISAYWG